MFKQMCPARPVTGASIALVILALIASPPSYAHTPRAPAAICQQLGASGKSQALLIDEHGQVARKGLDLGELDMSQHTDGGEFKNFPRKYQLILSPAGLRLENDCNMSVCIRVRKSRPVCRATSQYEITVAVLPWKFGPRHFSIEPTLDITDPTAHHDAVPELLFKPVAIGSVAMGWLEVEASDAGALERLITREGSASVTLINKGNRPMPVGPWLRGQGADTREIELDASACAARPLQAGQSCQATLRRTGHGALKQMVYTWTSDAPGHPYSTTFSFVQMNRDEVAINVINR